MNSNDGMVMWLLGGTGVFLLYSAYKNQQPQALLATYISGETAVQPISNYGSTPVPSGATPYALGESSDGRGLDTFAHTVPGHASGGLNTRQDISGTWNLIDTAGRMIGVVPKDYQRTPQLYIPTVQA